MTTYKLLYVLSFISLSPCYGQQGPPVDTDILTYGIYLEDRNVLVPWNTAIDSISSFGNPKITKPKRNLMLVSWDTVTVFRGIRSYMWCYSDKKFFSLHKYRGFVTTDLYFDTSSIDHVKEILDGYFGFKGPLHKQKHLYYYRWENKIFNVILINFRGKAKLLIQRPEKGRY